MEVPLSRGYHAGGTHRRPGARRPITSSILDPNHRLDCGGADRWRRVAIVPVFVPCIRRSGRQGAEPVASGGFGASRLRNLEPALGNQPQPVSCLSDQERTKAGQLRRASRDPRLGAGRGTGGISVDGHNGWPHLSGGQPARRSRVGECLDGHHQLRRGLLGETTHQRFNSKCQPLSRAGPRLGIRGSGASGRKSGQWVLSAYKE